jgi:hypothetical protein
MGKIYLKKYFLNYFFGAPWAYFPVFSGAGVVSRTLYPAV